MLRPLEDPAIPSEAVDDTPAPGWLCARRSRAGSHRGAQALGILRCRDVTGQPCIQVIRSVAAAARSASFQAGPLRRWRPPTFLFTPPNLKEDGKSPQSGPSDLQENPCYCNNPPPLTSSSTPVSKPQPFFPPTSSHVGCHLFVLGRGGDSAVPASASVLPCAHCHRPRLFSAGRALSAAAGSFQQACTRITPA